MNTTLTQGLIRKYCSQSAHHDEMRSDINIILTVGEEDNSWAVLQVDRSSEVTSLVSDGCPSL